jgi:hypothetical protein
MSRPTVRVIVPETPLYVDAFEARADYVGLGQADESPEYRLFIRLAPSAAPELAVLIHVSLDDARFLREAIDAVLQQYRAITGGAN